MNQQEVLEILGRVGAVITDSHVVYTSGKHGNAYVNKDAVYPRTGLTSSLCAAIAGEFWTQDVDVVLAPAVGGVILSQWTAWHLTKMLGREVLALYAEKSESGDFFVIKRGYDKMIAGKNVLVVEDVLTTGGTVKKVIEAARSKGGHVVGLGALCNRGGIKTNDVGGIPRLTSLVNVELESWDEADCPLCAAGVPINTDVGKGREFVYGK